MRRYCGKILCRENYCNKELIDSLFKSCKLPQRALFALKQKINKALGGSRLVLASIFGLTVAFSSDLGAWCTDYYQGLSARNQLLDCNDNIISRQYRIEKQSEESDVVKTKDGHAFIVFTGGHHKFDKGTDKIYDRSDNFGLVLGYE